MSDHPSTYHAYPGEAGGIDWDDRASLHHSSEKGGVLSAATSLGRGTFAEMIQRILALPEDARDHYVIEKAGDRQFSAAEAVELSKLPGFPGQ